ncbi:MAG: response regulator [Gammaproteobacteria bacterium]|nr:response regulator [Gammaproteobacteria bacterium]
MINEREIKDAHILVVDDEPMNLDLISEILAAAQFRNITTIADPTRVPELLNSGGIDLILLDLIMPVMSGFELMDKLNSLGLDPPPPVLVLTGRCDRQTRLQVLRGGARDILPRPFDSDEVLSRVYNLLEMHLAHKLLKSYNTQLEAAVGDRTRKLLRTQAEIIQRLGYAAEFRDTETGEHTIRVGRYSELLAKRIGLANEEAERILYAAPMHDIGKIGIPDAILLKPGRLNKEEWAVMKTHTTIGARILEGGSCQLLKSARTIALTHHERWDGSGHPNALKGEQIPLHGRIVAIADVFDALTLYRPYKPAWLARDARKYITEKSGSHFDPSLVAAFNDSWEEIDAIRIKYADEKPSTYYTEEWLDKLEPGRL